MNPKLEFLDDGRRVRLLADYIWEDSRGHNWIAKEGTICDGASIPRPAWWLIGSPFTGKYRNAAIPHDAYYMDHRGRTRLEVDKAFYEQMREDGVGRFKAWLIYKAVRIGGKGAWNASK